MQFELRCIQLKLIACFIISADNFRYFGAQQVCCLVARLCLSLGKSRRGANRMTGKALHMKGLLRRYISGGWDPWGINKKCLKILCSVFWLFSWRREPEKKGNREIDAVGRLYLDLDLVWELQQVPRQLLAMKVSGSEHHLQPRAASRPGGHCHAEVVLRLELHVGLKQRDAIITMTQIAALNQRAVREEAGTRQRMMRNRHLDQHPTPQPFCYFTLWLFPTLFHVFSNIILRPSGRSWYVNSHESAIKDIKS